jgi:NIPSNAP
METQVRIYRIKPGELDAFVDEWREHIVPLRRRFGFEVVAAWASEQEDTFIWVVSHDGDFAAADREYYLSRERAAMEPDPARHIEEPRTLAARPVPLP